MTLSPLSEAHMACVRFARDGDLEFVGEDAEMLTDEASRLLGLNEAPLAALREAVFRGVWRGLKSSHAHTDLDRLRREVARWEGAGAARETGISEYGETVAAWLRLEIERLEANRA